MAQTAPAAVPILRTRCRQCCDREATNQTVAAGGVCQGCSNPLDSPFIPIFDDGRAEVAMRLFKRVHNARANAYLLARFPCMHEEAVRQWQTPSWRVLPSSQPTKNTLVKEWLITSFEDVIQLCSFQTACQASRPTHQGHYNMRGSASGQISIIVPPLRLIHRCALSLHVFLTSNVNKPIII
jgi:hypothetical protein